MSKHNNKTLVIYSFDPWDHALAYQRYRAPAEKLGWIIMRGWRDGQCQFDLIKKADYVLIQRTFPASYHNYRQVMNIARKENKPVIYEIDDLLLAMPEEHPFLQWFIPTLEYILLAIIESDRVIVSSDVLKEVLLPFNPDIEIWPSYPPDWIWPSNPPSLSNKSQDNKVRIGFMGGLTHGVDLDMILPVLEKLAEEHEDTIEFHFWGSAPSRKIEGKTHLHHMEEVIDYRKHAELVCQLKVDIFVAPLVNNIFNRCKSSIKYWEYSALGRGGVYSRIAPYIRVLKHGINGFLVSTTEEWYQYLNLLINDKELRDHIAQNAYLNYNYHGKMSLHLDKWQYILTTTASRKSIFAKPDDIRYAYYRFAEQLCARSEENEKLIQQLREDNKHYAHQLDFHNQQLNCIYNSRSWQFVQLIAKIKRLLLR